METTVSKNKTAKVGEKYSYKYVDIAQIHAYLESIGARYYQYIDRIDGDDYVMTVRIIDGKEMPPLRGARVVAPTSVGATNSEQRVTNPAQQQGSALTYARRYSLLMAFGLATDDDDAQSLSVPDTDGQRAPERKASPKQVGFLLQHYKGKNLESLLERNGIEELEDLPMAKASELIGKLKERER